MTARISFPSADELDTGDCPDGYTRALYLIPADGSADGIPDIATHGGVGNIGTPVPAYHRRWLRIADYDANVVGQSVLDWLIANEDKLIELAERYVGTRWDGNNNVGDWRVDADHGMAALTESLSPIELEITHYRDADDWWGSWGTDWGELCEEAGVDGERAFDDDWKKVAHEVARKLVPLQDEPVRGAEEYLESAARRFRSRYAREGTTPNVPATQWIVPPEYGGQPVEIAYSYGCDDDGYWWERTRLVGAPARYRRWDSEELDGVTWDPWNSAPEVPK